MVNGPKIKHLYLIESARQTVQTQIRLFLYELSDWDHYSVPAQQKVGKIWQQKY